MTAPVYRWWTIRAWWEAQGQTRGVKLGPVTLNTYRFDGVRVVECAVLARWHWEWTRP